MNIEIDQLVRYVNFWVCIQSKVVAKHLNVKGFSPSIHDRYDYWYELEGFPNSKFWEHELEIVDSSAKIVYNYLSLINTGKHNGYFIRLN